ncbi:hypothetical protein, partial [Corynebacterium kozikiae]|uniref:hypothetical protein n=1 Tax=Corynebacterium kozikiae TaxID=2968469 RepID=UPI00211D0F77
ILRQNTILNQADHTVLRILIKLLWHVPDFPIYSNGTKPGTLQNTTDKNAKRRRYFTIVFTTFPKLNARQCPASCH